MEGRRSGGGGAGQSADGRHGSGWGWAWAAAMMRRAEMMGGMRTGAADRFREEAEEIDANRLPAAVRLGTPQARPISLKRKRSSTARVAAEVAKLIGRRRTTPPDPSDEAKSRSGVASRSPRQLDSALSEAMKACEPRRARRRARARPCPGTPGFGLHRPALARRRPGAGTGPQPPPR